MAEARQPPHNQDAERAILGAILLTSDALAAAVDAALTPEDFYRPAHGHIYAAALHLHAHGDPVDIVTVADHLTRSGLIEAAGGSASLIELHSAAPSTRSADRYARIVSDLAQLRRLQATAAGIVEAAYTGATDVPAALDAAEQAIYEVSQQRRRRNRAVQLGASLHDWLDRLEARCENGDTLGVPTGLIDLDAKILGFKPGQLVTLAGRPGMGKSALGGQFAAHAAASGHPTLFVSVEMSLEELQDRYVSSASQIDLTRIRSGTVGDRDWPHITEALGRLVDVPLHIHDDPSASVLSIRSEARRVASAAGGLGLIVVDYLQLMETAKRRENRQVEVAEVSAGLKRLARELEVPLVALAQLNRGLELRADKRPMLADLRESGAIENDSDIVIFIYRDDYYNTESDDRGTAELIIAKQRNGPTGTVKVAHFPETGRFTNMVKAG